MSRPLRTVSARYAEARRRNPNATVDLCDSDSETESISTSMIESVNQEARRTSLAGRGGPVPGSAAQDAEDSGSEYSTADDEQFVAAPLARRTTLQQEYSIPGPYADNYYSGSNDSDIDGVRLPDTSLSGMGAGHPSITPSPHHTTAQARAAELLRYNYGPWDPTENPRHLERFPDLGPEPLALVEVSNSLDRLVTSGVESVEKVRVESGPVETGAIQENETTPARQMTILQRTQRILSRNHVPKRPSTEVQFPVNSTEVQPTAQSPTSSQERRHTSVSDQQYRDAINQNFRLSGSTASVNSQSTETSATPGLKVNANRGRPNGLANGLLSSTGNGRPVPASTSGLRHAPLNTNRKCSIFTSKNKRIEEEQLHARGYGIEDTAKAFQEIEGRSREESELILGGHLDKIFDIAKPPSQYVDAARRVRFEETAAGPVQGSTAEADHVGSPTDGFVFMRIGKKVRALKKAIRGLGEKRDESKRGKRTA